MPGDLHKLWQVRDADGLPRRVRLLLHGLRDRRRARRTDGLPGPRRLRDGRRRLLPDDGHRAGDRRPGGDQGHRRAGPEPRLRLDRRALRVARLAALRHEATATGPRAAGSTATRCRSTWPPTPPASGCTSSGPTTPDELADAIRDAKAATTGTVIHVETDPLSGAPDSESWWDVPVSETSTLESTPRARATYDAAQGHPAALPQAVRHQLITAQENLVEHRPPPSTSAPPPTPGESGSPTTPSRRRPTASSRGRGLRLRVDRARPLRLPAERPRRAAGQARAAPPPRLGRHGLLGAAPARLVGRGVEAGHRRRRPDPRRSAASTSW